MKTTLSDAAKSPWAIVLAVATPIALGAVGRIPATRFTLPPFLNLSLRSTVVMGAAAGGVTALTQRILPKGREGQQPLELPQVASVPNPHTPTDGIAINFMLLTGKKITISQLPRDTTTCGYLMAQVAQALSTPEKIVPINQVFLFYNSKKLNITDSLATLNYTEDKYVHVILRTSIPVPPLVSDRLTKLYKAAFTGGRAQDNVKLIQQLATDPKCRAANLKSSQEQLLDAHLPRYKAANLKISPGQLIDAHLEGIERQFSLTQKSAKAV